MATTKTKGQLEAEIEDLRRRLAMNNGDGPLSFKVSERGAVSIYGRQRFPITLYKNQWEKVLEHQNELRPFIKDNEGKLKTKK